MLTIESALRKDKGNAHADGAMQHRHFAVVAGIIAELPRLSAVSGIQRGVVAVHFADALAATNSRFDRKRFLRACGVSEG